VETGVVLEVEEGSASEENGMSSDERYGEGDTHRSVMGKSLFHFPIRQRIFPVSRSM
jgi:hypothetical protein